MNTYKIALGTKDNQGNNLYYIPMSNINYSTTKDEAYKLETADDIEEFLHYRKKELRDYAKKFGWKVSVEKNNETLKNTFLDRYLEYINLKDEEIEKERVKRLKSLKLEKLALKSAIENKIMYISENTGYPFNINYFIDGYSYEEEVKEAMTSITKNGGVPYWAIVDHLYDGGLMISVLYVSLNKYDWDYERIDPTGIVQASVYNTTMGISEIGDIKIKSIMGALKRIG